MTDNVFAFMLLGRGYSSAGQQVLNKDIELKWFKSPIEKRSLEQKLLELQVRKDALMSAPIA